MTATHTLETGPGARPAYVYAEGSQAPVPAATETKRESERMCARIRERGGRPAVSIKVEPQLKPYQPNHRIIVPSAILTRRKNNAHVVKEEQPQPARPPAPTRPTRASVRRGSAMQKGK